ncbi:hypothetical protein SISNIDRAFT_469686 [Sistotremastrum niveocremeum HHB9708]|uniref:DUF6533 domain-containing protein n=1 Tax=Sistotremastrum niveocremeum HHB9708 TaxID=1314777 RepID=A0A164PRU1_9AGAM|nr:hypothetical protein SISNIDRAFT_469686 [Sistotremastrum niveocremeum HHB9708]
MSPLPLLSRSLFSLLEQTAQNLTLSRYIAFSGYITLLYDTLLLLPSEARLVWSARRSVAKWVYLGNKYVVVLVLTVVMNVGGVLIGGVELTGLSGVQYSDRTQFCKGWIATHTSIGVISLAVSNTLVLIRVCILWENRRLIFRILFSALLVVTTIAFSLSIYALTLIIPGVGWNAEFGLCVATSHTQLLALAWGIPLLFDVSVFFMTCWNALDRPREMHTAVTKALYQDGLFYFLAISSLRIFNVIVLWRAPISLVYTGVYFTWAMITTAMSRLLINLRQTEMDDPALQNSSSSSSSDSYFGTGGGTGGFGGRQTPFGMPVTELGKGGMTGLGRREREDPFRYSSGEGKVSVKESTSVWSDFDGGRMGMERERNSSGWFDEEEEYEMRAGKPVLTR